MRDDAVLNVFGAPGLGSAVRNEEFLGRDSAGEEVLDGTDVEFFLGV